MIMKTGIFCNFENHHQDSHRAFTEQIALVKHAESLGFEYAWVTEHHFNEFSVSSSSLVLMSYLAGITSNIKLGSGAVLLAFHNPIRVAEDIATLDHLSNGRLVIGIAKGGPFPEQNKHFQTPMNESRPKTVEAINLIHRLLYDDDVKFYGKFYEYEGISIYPKPLQKNIPVYVATSDEDAIAFAAINSFGLMGGLPFTLERLKNNITKYREVNPSGADKLMVTRFFYVAPTNEQAISEALPFIRKFSDRMKGFREKAHTCGNHSQHLHSEPGHKSCFDEDVLLEHSIIGDVVTCRDKIKRFQDELNLDTLTLQPASFDLQKNLDILTRYNQEIRFSLNTAHF